MSNRNELLALGNETLVTDEFGRVSSRVIINTEVGNRLVAGRVLLIQTEAESLGVGEYIELALFSSEPTPLTFISLDVTAQLSELTMDVLEGGTGIAGGVLPTTINPNRVNIPTPNTTAIEGTPANPITGTDGATITPPGGWKIIGTEGPSDSQYINDTVDIGGFICQPGTWYQLRITNTSQANRPVQLSLKLIDPGGA